MQRIGLGKAAAVLLSMLCIAAEGPQPGDFVVAAGFATRISDDETSGGDSPEPAPAPIIVAGPDEQAVSLQDYRHSRSACELNRLIRIRGRSEVGVEWRCGPLNARWNDVYAIEEGRVARVIANVPLLVTAPDGRTRR